MKSTLSRFDVQLDEQGIDLESQQHLNESERQQILANALSSFGKRQGVEQGESEFLVGWSNIEKISATFGLDLKQAVLKEFAQAEPVFVPATQVQILKAFQWDPNLLTEQVIDNVLKTGSEEDAQEVLSHIPKECITARNGALLYKALRSYTLNDKDTPQSIPALLNHIEPLKCLKPRFQEVSPEERMLVVATLAPFLEPPAQSQVFKLLEDSLNRTKNKSPLQNMQESQNPKAQEFIRLWDKFKTRHKGGATAGNGAVRKM